MAYYKIESHQNTKSTLRLHTDKKSIPKPNPKLRLSKTIQRTKKCAIESLLTIILIWYKYKISNVSQTNTHATRS